MESSSELIERLQKGEEIKCIDCGNGYYTTSADDVSISHEFSCNKCNSVIRVSPNITID